MKHRAKETRFTFATFSCIAVSYTHLEFFEDNRKEKLRLQKSTFSMFDGGVETVTMVFRVNMMNAVIDKFGKDVFIVPVDKEHFQISVPVAVSQQFYGWVFGLGNYVTCLLYTSRCV